jgi:hypothetical protein
VYRRVTVGAVLLNTRQIEEIVDCRDTYDIVVHVSVELNTGTVALGSVFLSAVLAHQGSVTARRSTTKAEEVKLVFTLALVGSAAAKEVGRYHGLRPGRVDEAGRRRVTNGWSSGGGCGCGGSGVGDGSSGSRREERF